MTSLRVTVMEASDEAAYEALRREKDWTFLFASCRYRDLVLSQAGGEPRYLLAWDGGRLAGALPLVLKRQEQYGAVLNSLPYYGSNGGVCTAEFVSDPEPVYRVLLGAMNDLAAEHRVVLSTVIANPFDPRPDLYEALLEPAYSDERVGQVIKLPSLAESPEETAFSLMHSSRRWDVRKAMKQDVLVEHNDSAEAMQFLAETHRENISALGGLYKPASFFENVRRCFRYDQDYRVYTASISGNRVSALLVFFYNRTAEYYTPAVLEAFRSTQANSLLTFASIRDAVERGCRYYNFGGTWKSQSGVYQYKKKWGAEDFPYRYYVKAYADHDSLLDLSPAEAVAAYPYFYTVPFQYLRGGKP